MPCVVTSGPGSLPDGSCVPTNIQEAVQVRGDERLTHKRCVSVECNIDQIRAAQGCISHSCNAILLSRRARQEPSALPMT